MTKPESPTKLISTGTRQYQKKWSSPSQHVVEKFAIDAKKKDAHDITSYVSTESTCHDCHHCLREQISSPARFLLPKIQQDLLSEFTNNVKFIELKNLKNTNVYIIDL